MARRSGPSRSVGEQHGAPPHGASVSVVVEQNTVRLGMPAGAEFPRGTLSILADGNPLAQFSNPRASDTLTFTLPPHLLPGTLDLVEVTTGRSLFATPVVVQLDLTLDHISLQQCFFHVTASLPASVAQSLAFLAVNDDGQFFAAGVLAPEGRTRSGRQRYSGQLPLLQLLPLKGVHSLTIYLSGRRMPEPFETTAYAAGFAGYVDQASGEGIRGWATDLSNPRRRLKVDVFAGDRLIGRVTADKARPDLAALKAGTQSGFRVPKSMLKDLEHGEVVSIRIEGTETNLGNSPQRVSTIDIRGLFDNIEGNQACGWVIDMARPDLPCTVEAVCEGKVIGTAVANGLRRDVLEAGLPTDRCGFRVTFDEPLHTLFHRDIDIRVKDRDVILNGGPQQPKLNPNIQAYLLPDRGIGAEQLERLRRRMDHAARGSGLSIVMPVYNTRAEWLSEALRSVVTQWCGAWELICVNDASTAPHVAAMLEWFARMDTRIRVITSPRNEGIAGATTRGIQAARLPFVALMDHDDVLEPDAVHHILATAKATGADLIYSDEALTGEDSSVVLDVRARPAFSHDYYLSHPYFVHMIAVRTRIAQDIGGFDVNLAISADVDFVLRVIERSGTVAHIPRVLYRWRTHAASTGHARQGQVMAATAGAIQRHLDRMGSGAVARPAAEFNQFEITWPDPGGRVLIVIPTKDGVDMLRQCISSIEATAPAGEYRILVIDHESKEPQSRKYLAEIAARHTVMPYKGAFNYARMNNLAIRNHAQDEPFLLFMNNDIEAVEKGWFQRMRSLAARAEVGAVGTALMYNDRRTQHAGVIVGINGLADHALRFEALWEDDGNRRLGYNASLTSVRDFSAVTAACMMMRRAVFDDVGRFDEAYAVGFNDTDLCLRIGRAGYKVLYDGRTVLFHHESVTRIAKAHLKHPKDDEKLRQDWGDLLRQGDPYYSPLLELYGTDHKLRSKPCGPAAPRAVTLRRSPAIPPAAPAKAQPPGRRTGRKAAAAAALGPAGA